MAILRAAAVVRIPIALIRALRMDIISLLLLSGLLAAALLLAGLLAATLLLAGLLTWVLVLLARFILVLLVVHLDHPLVAVVRNKQLGQLEMGSVTGAQPPEPIVDFAFVFTATEFCEERDSPTKGGMV